MFARTEIKPLPKFSVADDFARIAVVTANDRELRVIARIRPVRESADPTALAAFAVEISVLKIARAADPESEMKSVALMESIVALPRYSLS